MKYKMSKGNAMAQVYFNGQAFMSSVKMYDILFV